MGWVVPVPPSFKTVANERGSIPFEAEGFSRGSPGVVFRNLRPCSKITVVLPSMIVYRVNEIKTRGTKKMSGHITKYAAAVGVGTVWVGGSVTTAPVTVPVAIAAGTVIAVVYIIGKVWRR